MKLLLDLNYTNAPGNILSVQEQLKSARKITIIENCRIDKIFINKKKGFVCSFLMNMLYY